MELRTLTAAAIVAMAAGTANAALIDFTDASVWLAGGTPQTSAVVGGLTIEVTTNPVGSLTFNAFGDSYGGPAGVCQASGGPLSCTTDGAGVIDDETTGKDQTAIPPLQSITVTFKDALGALAAVNISELRFLDLFKAPSFGTTGNTEFALVAVNGAYGSAARFDAQANANTNGGYGQFATNLFNVTSLTFFTGDSSNVANTDEDGTADYGVGAIQFSAVPLPAAAWMLLAGIGGLTFLGRRRAA